MENENFAKKIVTNIFWLASGQAFSRVIKGVVIVYIARVLGAEDYGVLSYALAIVGIVTLFSDLGLSRILTREVSKSKEDMLRVLATATRIKMILILPLIFILSFIIPIFIKIEGVQSLLLVFAIMFTADGLRDIGFAFVRALEKMHLEALASTVMNIAIAVFSFWAIIVRPSPLSIAWAYTAGSILGTIIIFFLLRKYVMEMRDHYTPDLVRPIINSAWPYAVLNFLGVIMYYSDILILSWLKPITELGYYSAGQRIIQLIVLLPGLVAAGVLPAMSRFVRENTERFVKISSESLTAVLALALPGAVIAIALGPDIVHFLYGTEYEPAVSIFAVLALSILASFPAAILSNIVLARDLQKTIVPFMIGGALVNIILNFLLVPSFGGTGAAASTTIAQFGTQIVIYNLLQKSLPDPLSPRLGKIVISSLVMLGVIHAEKLFGLNFWLIIFSSAGTYILMLALLREQLLKNISFLFFKNA